MNVKEKILYTLGLIIIAFGAFIGRDLSNTTELFEGGAMFLLFLSLFIVFYYFGKRGGFPPYVPN